MDFDFVIPLSIDDLQESSSSRQYAVSYVSSANEIEQRISECMQAFRREGINFILDQNIFDLLYSAVLKFKSLSEDVSLRIWGLVLKVVADMVEKVSEVLSNDQGLPNSNALLLVVKMNTYIACSLTEAFESNFNKPSIELPTTGKRGKKSSKKCEFESDWEDERMRMLVQLYSLIQLPLNRLWTPPVIDEDFVNLIANCCYKFLESSTMAFVRTKGTRDSIFQILGTLVRKYNHGLACALKLMQLLQHFEHLVSPAAQGIILLMENYGGEHVLQEMIREIVKIDAKDASKESGIGNYAQFLIEISVTNPHVFIPSLPLLISFLDQDPYTMRNCVLVIMGSIVSKVLKGETLDTKSKNLRDECLEYLQDFIHDVNAFVRSKVLQIWESLIEAQAVPLAQQQPILKKVVGRLRDKSSNVRKYALHLLAAFLKANPFAAKLPLEDLEEELDSEMKQLQELKPGASLDGDDDEAEDGQSIDKAWIELVPELIKALKKLLKEDSDSEESSDETNEEAVKSEPEDEDASAAKNDECFSLNDGVSGVGESLAKGDHERAVRTLQKVMKDYADAPILQVDLCDDSCEVFPGFNRLSDDQKRLFTLLHRIFFSYTAAKKQMEKEELTESEGSSEKNIREEEIKKKKKLCCYLRDSVSFAKQINLSLSDICQLLASRQITDILEAIDFFVTAFEFGVLNAMAGVRKMLSLIWSKEQTIKDAVVNAYRRLYMKVDASSERSKALYVVQNLTALITGATLGELTSMEEIVSEFFKTGDINRHCITLLWERFTKALPETTDDEAKAAIVLLTMAANSEINIISSNLNILIEVGLGERGKQDFSLVKNVCLALCKLGTTKLKTDDPQPPFRRPQTHELFSRLSSLVVEGLSAEKDPFFSPMVIEAVNAIYLLAEHPDVICGKMIQDMARLLLSSQSQAQESGIDDSSQSQDTFSTSVSMGMLSRFLTTVGHVALRQLIHMDTFIFTEIKRRNFVREEQAKSKKSKKKRASRKSLATSASEVTLGKSNNDGDIDEEMGLTGAIADDLEAEYIRSICETEIVKGENLLAFFRPLIVGVCANPTKYSDPNLRTASALALSKYMLVSSECCEENLQLLFTILEKSTEPVIRANTIIAVGDLICRFPNLVEPWTSRIYARLRDESIFVRRNTLTVLTHLILNDQVKVKGQISDIALCVTDEEIRISGLAKLFFNELSKKGNALYNILPDIISRLSDTDSGVEEKDFRTVISYIFGLIQKDRQLETFIEKLCHRLQATNIQRQWRDITFCLSLLPYSEKGIRKLTENFSCFNDKLHDDEIYDLFSSILSNAKKLAKPELKTAVEELESKFEECRQKGVEDERLVSKANKAKKSKSVAKGRKTRTKYESSDESDDSAFEMEPVKDSTTPPRRTTRKSGVQMSNGK